MTIKGGRSKHILCCLILIRGWVFLSDHFIDNFIEESVHSFRRKTWMLDLFFAIKHFHHFKRGTAENMRFRIGVVPTFLSHSSHFLSFFTFSLPLSLFRHLFSPSLFCHMFSPPPRYRHIFSPPPFIRHILPPPSLFCHIFPPPSLFRQFLLNLFSNLSFITLYFHACLIFFLHMFLIWLFFLFLLLLLRILSFIPTDDPSFHNPI